MCSLSDNCNLTYKLYVYRYVTRIVPWIKGLVAGMPRRRPRLDRSSLHVSFVVENWEIGTRSVSVACASITALVINTRFHLHVALTKRTKGSKAGNLPETIPFQKSGCTEQKSTSTYQHSNNSTKFFLGPRGNAGLVNQRFSYRYPNTTFKSFAETHPSQSCVIFAIIQPPPSQKIQNSQTVFKLSPSEGRAGVTW